MQNEKNINENVKDKKINYKFFDTYNNAQTNTQLNRYENINSPDKEEIENNNNLVKEIKENTINLKEVKEINQIKR